MVEQQVGERESHSLSPFTCSYINLNMRKGVRRNIAAVLQYLTLSVHVVCMSAMKKGMWRQRTIFRLDEKVILLSITMKAPQTVE